MFESNDRQTSQEGSHLAGYCAEVARLAATLTGMLSQSQALGIPLGDERSSVERLAPVVRRLEEVMTAALATAATAAAAMPAQQRSSGARMIEWTGNAPMPQAPQSATRTPHGGESRTPHGGEGRAPRGGEGRTRRASGSQSASSVGPSRTGPGQRAAQPPSRGEGHDQQPARTRDSAPRGPSGPAGPRAQAPQAPQAHEHEHAQGQAHAQAQARGGAVALAPEPESVPYPSLAQCAELMMQDLLKETASNPTGPREVTFQGTNESLPLSSVFEFIGKTKKTGTMRVRTADETMTFELTSGTLVSSTTDNPPPRQRLGQILVDLGYVTEEALDEFLSRRDPSQKLGDALAREELVALDDLRQALEFQVKNRLFRAFSAKDSAFTFSGGESPAPDEKVGVQLTELLKR